MHSTHSNSIPPTSVLFAFSHLRLGLRNGLFQTPPHQNPVSIYFTPNICRTSHPSGLPRNTLSAVTFMKPFSMRPSPASIYFPFLTLMLIMMTNVALPSDARIRNRSHICTSINPMISTRGVKHTFHVQRNILASLLYLAIKSAAKFP